VSGQSFAAGLGMSATAQPGARRRGPRIHDGSATWAAVAGVPKSDGRPVRRCTRRAVARTWPGLPQVGVFRPGGSVRPARRFLCYPQWMGVGPVQTMIQTRRDAKALVSTC
jgi:hypothetical protein